MALLIISQAIGAGIQRSVELSTMKHEAKIEDTKLSLAAAALTRMDHHSKRLTEARIDHATWVGGLNPAAKQCYEASLADLQAAIAPAPTSN